MNRLQRFAYHPNFWIVVVVENIFLIVGSILILGSSIAYLHTLLFLAKAKSVQGTIIDLVPDPNASSECNFLRVAFREETTRHSFEFISSICSSPTAHNEDERIRVFYDPENPKNAKIGDSENLLNLFVIPTFLFLLAAFFFLCPFLSIRIRRKIMR